MFADVKKHTGIDLVDHATVAKHVMEISGDARQKSLLEQVNLLNVSPHPSSVGMTLWKKIVDSANSPDARIRRSRALTVPETPRDGVLNARDVQPTGQEKIANDKNNNPSNHTETLPQKGISSKFRRKKRPKQ